MTAGSTAVVMAALAAVTLLVALNAAAQEPAWTAGCGDCNKDCVALCEQKVVEPPCSAEGNLGLFGIELCQKSKPAALKLCNSGCYSGKCAALAARDRCPGDVDKLCTACLKACDDGSCTSGQCRADCVSANCVSGSGCPASSP